MFCNMIKRFSKINNALIVICLHCSGEMELPPKWKQAIFASGALFNLMTIGMVYGYTGILLPAILNPTSDIHVDKYMASWLASLCGISGLIPVLALGPIMHIYGRRVASFCITIPTLLGWTFTSISYSLPMLVFSRFLHSLGIGAIYFFAICIGEFSSPSIRCTLLNMKTFSAGTGIAIMHVLGYFLHWRPLALVGAGSSIIALIITFFWPETPDWLASKGRFDEAEAVFFYLRGRSEESEIEIKKLIETEKSKKNQKVTLSISDVLRKLRSKTLWRPVILLNCAIIIIEFGGKHFFPAYSIQLISHLSGSQSSFFYTYIIDALSILSAIPSFYLINRFNRRQLLLYSGYGAVTVLLIASVVMFISTNLYKNRILTWFSLCLLATYFFIAFSSTFSAAYILMGELFPLEYKAIGSVLNGILQSINVVFIMKLTPILKDNLNVHGMLLVYAFCMLITLIYLHYDLPETKGRTLQDIGDYFRGKSPKVTINEVAKSAELNSILSK